MPRKKLEDLETAPAPDAESFTREEAKSIAG